MPANLSGPTLLVVLFIVLLLFGAPKLPALARSVGQSMKILKKEVSTDNSADEFSDSQSAVSSRQSAQERLLVAQKDIEEARAELDKVRMKE